MSGRHDVRADGGRERDDEDRADDQDEQADAPDDRPDDHRPSTDVDHDGGERDRGVLTPADRAYLRGDRTYGSVQAERNARARIRQRVVDALLDFEVLVEHLDDRDLDLVFADRVDAAGTDGFDALVSAVAFVHDGASRTDLDFETVLREGVNLAAARDDRAATVDLSVTYHALDADGLLGKLADGEDLSLTEIAYLHEADGVSREELAAHFEDREDLDDGRVQAKVTDY